MGSPPGPYGEDPKSTKSQGGGKIKEGHKTLGLAKNSIGDLVGDHRLQRDLLGSFPSKVWGRQSPRRLPVSPSTKIIIRFAFGLSFVVICYFLGNEERKMRVPGSEPRE